jgi:hypothetical protein
MTSVKVAELIVERYRLRPPVNIETLLEDVADVSELEWSYDVDGMVTGLSGRPRVFLRSNQAKNRKRFTSAHEYGHIQIPWHTESLACQIDAGQRSSNPVQEREASDFASHILVPRKFLREILVASGNVEDWLERLGQCEISAHATLIALREQLPPGYVFAVEGVDNPPDIIVSSGTVFGFNFPLRNDHLPIFDKESVSVGRVGFRNRSIRWWQYLTIEEPKLETVEPSKNILARVVEKYGDELSNGRSRLHTINGVIGAALRDRRYRTPGQMIGSVLYQFRNTWNVEIREMASDSEFQHFVERRIIEVYERNQGTTS